MAKTILIVDDDMVNVKVVQSRLQKQGYNVPYALNGEIALNNLEDVAPDLILLDVEMPTMNGYTFMLEMRKEKKFDAIPVIILTAHNEMEPIFKFNGVKGYITKPINFDTLFQKMAAIGI
jgi:CheY-like chemotaxis protein